MSSLDVFKHEFSNDVELEYAVLDYLRLPVVDIRL